METASLILEGASQMRKGLFKNVENYLSYMTSRRIWAVVKRWVRACDWRHWLHNSQKVVKLSRAFCDPRRQSNQIMSAAQHLALINTIGIRARIMEIVANYKMASSDSEITFLKNNLSNFETQSYSSNSPVLSSYSTFISTMFSLVLAIWKNKLIIAYKHAWK